MCVNNKIRLTVHESHVLGADWWLKIMVEILLELIQFPLSKSLLKTFLLIDHFILYNLHNLLLLLLNIFDLH